LIQVNPFTGTQGDLTGLKSSKGINLSSADNTGKSPVIVRGTYREGGNIYGSEVIMVDEEYISGSNGLYVMGTKTDVKK